MGFTLVNAFDFTSYELETSSLSDVSLISPSEIYTEITPSGTWHYYQVVTTLTTTPTINNLVGTTITNKGILIGDRTEITTRTETQKDVCKDKLNEENATIIICSKQTFTEDRTVYRFTENPNGKIKILKVKTPNWARGTFNPSLSGCGVIASEGIYTLTDALHVDGANCLTVNANNVLIDCAGFNITGNNAS